MRPALVYWLSTKTWANIFIIEVRLKGKRDVKIGRRTIINSLRSPNLSLSLYFSFPSSLFLCLSLPPYISPANSFCHPSSTISLYLFLWIITNQLRRSFWKYKMIIKYYQILHNLKQKCTIVKKWKLEDFLMCYWFPHFLCSGQFTETSPTLWKWPLRLNAGNTHAAWMSANPLHTLLYNEHAWMHSSHTDPDSVGMDGRGGGLALPQYGPAQPISVHFRLVYLCVCVTVCAAAVELLGHMSQVKCGAAVKYTVLLEELCKGTENEALALAADLHAQLYQSGWKSCSPTTIHVWLGSMNSGLLGCGLMWKPSDTGEVQGSTDGGQKTEWALSSDPRRHPQAMDGVWEAQNSYTWYLYGTAWIKRLFLLLSFPICSTFSEDKMFLEHMNVLHWMWHCVKG